MKLRTFTDLQEHIQTYYPSIAITKGNMPIYVADKRDKLHEIKEITIMELEDGSPIIVLYQRKQVKHVNNS